MMMRRDPVWLWGAFAILLAGFGVYFWRKSAPEPVVAERIVAFSDVAVLKNRKAVMTLAGTSIPVQLETAFKNDLLTIAAIADDKPVDSELYRINPTGVHLLQIAGDQFNPELPLFSTPGIIGESATWEGRVAAAGSSDRADAKISSGREDLNVTGGPFASIRVEVDLRISSDQGTPRERQMVFWLVDGQGIVKRDIVGISTREPR